MLQAEETTTSDVTSSTGLSVPWIVAISILAFLFVAFTVMMLCERCCCCCCPFHLTTCSWRNSKPDVEVRMPTRRELEDNENSVNVIVHEPVRSNSLDHITRELPRETTPPPQPPPPPPPPRRAPVFPSPVRRTYRPNETKLAPAGAAQVAHTLKIVGNILTRDGGGRRK